MRVCVFMVVCTYVRMCLVSFGYVTFVLHLARGICFDHGFARVSDPYMILLFSKCTSRVVVVRSWVRFSKFHSRVVVIRT